MALILSEGGLGEDARSAFSRSQLDLFLVGGGP
jgi:hypothetical protein